MRHPTHLHSGTIPWSKIRILVYGQDDAFRFLVRQTFRKLAVREVLSTSVPADATPMMSQAPDIALVDLEGGLDMALAFLKRVRTGDPGMPVLVVAKSDAHALLAPAQALGINGLVPKPVSGHELVHRIQAALREPRRVPAPPPAAPTLPPSPAPARPVAPRTGHGGGAVHAIHAGSRKVSGGKLALGDGDLPAPPPKEPAGTYADDEAPPPPAVKGAPGTYAEVADDVATKPAAAKSAAKGRLDGLIAALPDMLKPRRRRKDEEEQAEAERARWQEELARAGHHSRSGKDVAGLDVEAVVAAHLQWLTSQGAEGRRADFRKMDLAGGALAGTVLANAGFREADLSDAQLAEARLDGADFRHATLAAADLTAANLGVAQLRHCDLRLANLQGAWLRGADLSGARLRGAKLAGADFKGAILVGCDLSDADLSQVENLTQPQVEKAVCDAKTKLPPGIRPPRRDEG